jgi:histidinol-phosphate aminotransferase
MTASGGGRRPIAFPHPLRLDLTTNPYGLSIRVQEALAAAEQLHMPSPDRQRALRRRLADREGVPPDWIVLAAGIEELTAAIVRWRRVAGPLIVFDPTSCDAERIADLHGMPVEHLTRSHRFAVDLDPALVPFFTEGATAYVLSPNDPTGTLLAPADAVRLSRGCAFLVVDERHGPFSPRSLLPLAREFANIVVLRSLAGWAGLEGFPVAYAVAPPKVVAAIERHLLQPELPAGSAVAAAAVLDDLAFVEATVTRVIEEKSRLYRMLRKLNVVQPVASWANFLMAHVERGERDGIATELANRGILVYRPPQAALANYLRISASTPDATDALRDALIEIARGIGD